jgi:hypothetical protein
MGDVIGVVEAAYAIDLDEFAWLRGILERAAPLLDDGLGVMANSFDVDARSRVVTRATVFVGIDDAHAPAIAQTGAGIPAEQVGQMLRMSVSTMSDLWGAPADVSHQRGIADKLAAADFLGIVAANPVGHGVVISAPLRAVTRTDPAFVRRWGRVASHIAAAARMRQKLGACVEADTPELSAAALAVGRARGSLRHQDADAALELWRPLVAGRWTLIEIDGRVMARENAPDGGNTAEAFAALGHPPDLVAYELGLA